LIDLPGVNVQERTHKDLLESLRSGVEDMPKSPCEKKEEELINISVWVRNRTNQYRVMEG
jgi:hypothetical protein